VSAAHAPLPAGLTVHALEALRDAWCLRLDDPAPRDGTVVLDGASVDEVDAAGLQWLVSLRRALAGRGLALRVTPASGALREAGRTLGLLAAAGLDDEGDAR
jgi:anti-anti-sigma regulatory factor